MKTVCLLGSPRRGGNSDTMAEWFCTAARQSGADVETLALADLDFNGCRNLFRCKTGLDHCGQEDDLTPVLASIRDADVLVLASPLYFTSVSGQMKLAIDRFFSFFVPDYTTNEEKSRLGKGRTLVFIQTQGEPESQYADLLDSFSKGFRYLGFDNQHLLRAWGVREPGEVSDNADLKAQCEATAESIYGN